MNPNTRTGCATAPERSSWTRFRRELLATLWQQPLWAIPFALFFGTLYGAALRSYWIAYQISLVFAFFIRLAMAAMISFVVPRLSRRSPREGGTPFQIEAPAYLIAALAGSYAAAYVIHRFMLPGFMGSPRAIAISGAYTVLFTVTFGGVAYAIAFYRQSLARARAIEGMRAELAEAELRALRAQVNPHFLFNTLNSIAALIRDDPAEAEETTTRLAEVFRYTLRTSEHEHARLGEELDFLRAYLEIERTRFGTRLRIEEKIAPGLEALLVPSLLLQPIVENAIRHGIAERPDGGVLAIAAMREGDRLVVEVADDGPGMDGAPARPGTGFGLHSVRERLRAAGPPHALDVESESGRGTRVRITLPVLERSPKGASA